MKRVKQYVKLSESEDTMLIVVIFLSAREDILNGIDKEMFRLYRENTGI